MFLAETSGFCVTGRRQLAEVRIRLSDRDQAVLTSVSRLRLATGAQIGRLHLPVSQHASAHAAAVVRGRLLARLVGLDVLAVLPRRVGGASGGSGQQVYALGRLGQRLVGLSTSRPWQSPPSMRFVDHCLAVTEVQVGLTEGERAGRTIDLQVTAEPDCWRRFSGLAGLQVLKPDLLVELTTVDHDDRAGGWELRWFVEVDRSTEHLPTVIRKCQTYQRYWRSGLETERHDVFPRVLWSVPDEPRAQAIRVALERTRSLSGELFRVATAEETLAVLSRIGEDEEASNQQERQGGET